MTQVGKDTLGTRSTLSVNGKDYAYYSFAKAEATIRKVLILKVGILVLVGCSLDLRRGDVGQDSPALQLPAVTGVTAGL